MAQTIALLAQNPKIDLQGSMLGAQRYRAGEQDIQANEIKNTLAGAQANDEIGQLGALSDYRKAAGAGDPNALAKLRAYPELQSKFHAALDTMKPDAQKAAIERGTEIAAAAQRVAALPPDSPQRKAAWNTELDALKKKGAIDQSHYDAYYNTPSDLVIDQALSLGQSIKDFTAARSKAKEAADTGLDPKELLAIEKAANDYSKTYYGSNNQEFLTDAQIKDRDVKVEAYKQNLIAQSKAAKATPGSAAAAAGPKPNVLDLTPRVTPAPAATQRPGVGAGASLYDPTPIAAQGGRPAVAAPKGDRVQPAATAADWKPGMALPPTHTGASQPKTQADFDALPYGAPFINPADGRPMFKGK